MNSVSNISLCMRPQVAPFGWDEFCETHPPYAIALDGYVAARSRFDLTGPRLNLDHHSGVDRLATRASCAQTLLAIRQGLFECFRDGDGPQAQVCVNDCDEDICTSWFLLRNAHVAVPGAFPRLDRLVSLVDILDTTAGAYRIPDDLSALKELAWIFAPYHSFRRSGELNRRQPEEHRDIVTEVLSRIERHLHGQGGSYLLDGRYERRGGGPGWSLIQEIGAQARLGATADGIRAYVAVRERLDGRWSYVVGRMSPFVPFDVPALLHALNEAEGTTRDRWGGSNLVGGSPRIRGRLPGQTLEDFKCLSPM
ncbi:MAG TPA: hypothetical protein VH575_07655 [Gemmataceae bacterium]